MKRNLFALTIIALMVFTSCNNPKPVKTIENLKAGIIGETYEETTMYPAFLEAAKTEKVAKATKSFTWAMNTEKKHKEFYIKALAALKAHNTGSLSFDYAVCPVCGNTYEMAKMDAMCAFCGTPKLKFIMI